ncbi:MAG: permease prefix domain 1-containing protein [Oscillospiraceae bacterium]|nr:permease prefix domain 1-containing protein [Oscillospiraceae bacterium]
MNDRIKEYVEKLFLGTPHTRQAADVKEELLANLQAKYEDMLNSGKSEDEAYTSVISGIGDIRSLLGETPVYNTEAVSSKRHTSSVLRAVAIMVLIFSIVPLIVLDALFSGTWLTFIIPISFLSVLAVGVGLLVLSFSLGPKKYVKGDDTFVEEYKEKVSGNDRNARLWSAISSTLWITVIALYLLIGLTTNIWHPTWLIFIVGALVQNMLRFLLKDPKGYKKLVNSTIWLTAAIFYLWFSFATLAWHWSWIIFIIAALVQQVIKLIDIWREEE